MQQLSSEFRLPQPYATSPRTNQPVLVTQTPMTKLRISRHRPCSAQGIFNPDSKDQLHEWVTSNFGNGARRLPRSVLSLPVQCSIGQASHV
eukprot:s690_g11.t1